jgi:hypothetical protein
VDPFAESEDDDNWGGTDDGEDPPPPPPPPPPEPEPDTDDDPDVEDDGGSTSGPEGDEESESEDGTSEIRLKFGEFRTDTKLWRLKDSGVLEFNIRHSLWAKAETDDKKLKRLIQYVMCQAYTQEFVKQDLKLGEEMSTAFEMFSEQADELFLKMLLQ